jgi:S-methylmethionine-dependent homocysteine/selenocysteine methylase
MNVAGTSIIGGCCGRSPDHVRVFRVAIDEHVSKMNGKTGDGART